jgi:hypothetical protein
MGSVIKELILMDGLFLSIFGWLERDCEGTTAEGLACVE